MRKNHSTSHQPKNNAHHPNLDTTATTLISSELHFRKYDPRHTQTPQSSNSLPPQLSPSPCGYKTFSAIVGRIPPGDVEWVLCGISKRNPEAIGWTGKCRTRREREREGREKKCDGCGGLCSSKQAGKAGPAKPNQAKAEVVYDVGCRC